jgi:hypothetical protein
MLSQNGTLGHVVRRVHTMVYPLAGPVTIVMHSDGISGSWSPSAYPGLFAANPVLVAAVLYRDFARPQDDATVLAARLP